MDIRQLIIAAAVTLVVALPAVCGWGKKAAPVSARYLKNPRAKKLDERQERALAVGLIDSEQNGYYADSLETGGDKHILRRNLLNYYRIDSVVTAQTVLGTLLGYGHRYYYPFVAGYLSGGRKKDFAKDLEFQKSNEDLVKTYKEFYDNLDECVQYLTDESFISSREDLAEADITAWDMGRAVCVVRACFDCGYLEREEAWRYLDGIYTIAHDASRSWKEFSREYLIGRSLWHGRTDGLAKACDIVGGLLKDDDSPWRDISI